MPATIFPFTKNSNVISAPTPTPALSELLARYDIPGPRYTSYPTIDQCTESVGAIDFEDALRSRCLGGLRRPMSLYVHVPFCESVCYYCACNKVVTKKHDRVAHYLNCLEREAMLVAKMAAGNLTPVTQFHMGGGTPTFMTDQELLGLVQGLKMVFPFAANAEMSIEVDPRTVDEVRLLSLRGIGFNRISFGVQDFDPCVQKAVHREQSFESVELLMKAARRFGYESINVDLIYGLPKQTPESFAQTLDQLISLSPDRVAMYGYAHMPDRFRPQRRIHEADLPDAEGRVALLAMAIERMQSAGYEYIGMDHFAKPSDSLAVAKRQGRLHRNFQGYTTQPDADLIGLGVSAISKVGSVMVQNTRDLNEYEDSLSRGHLALFRGHACNRDDLIRYSVIMALLCQGSVQFADFSQSHWIDFDSYFGDELAKLEEFMTQGLVTLTPTGIEVTTVGWFFIRPIAMVFDRYQHLRNSGQSKVL
ncbi:MAG: oxygen-independent coproporphyrinogen III oxidase [Burkholderiales bacterium]|jgi:oxygen-independent coproporphyrinogen-3 oxidase|uniref:oxygen-independent coproporphyrinogen III oxidase n=1 Tax=Limnobacter sp. TaxID=2003368 RepID=UPI003942CCEA|nr:oxygen-independent coproporphyrinogen III oxidase [Burkholderiales bacterium]